MLDGILSLSPGSMFFWAWWSAQCVNCLFKNHLIGGDLSIQSVVSKMGVFFGKRLNDQYSVVETRWEENGRVQIERVYRIHTATGSPWRNCRWIRSGGDFRVGRAWNGYVRRRGDCWGWGNEEGPQIRLVEFISSHRRVVQALCEAWIQACD